MKNWGGLDERCLPVTFNDVWTPHAELYHRESASRGKDRSAEKTRRVRREVAFMRKRWKQVLRHDPFYNPNLSQERPDFSLSNAPLVERPWLA